MITKGPLGSVSAGPRNIAARRLIALALGINTTLVLPGCYAFVPTTTTALPEATPVTVQLSDDGTVALAGTLGRGITEVEGSVVRSSTDSLTVAVERMYTAGHQLFASSGSTVAIPRTAIDQVQVRTFSRKRTVLTIIGGVVLGVVAGASVKAGGGSSTGDGGGGVTPP